MAKTRLTITALILLATATIALTAASIVGTKKDTPRLDPEVTWCRILQDTRAPYSCDWDNPNIPAAALQHYQNGDPAITAHAKAIKESNNK